MECITRNIKYAFGIWDLGPLHGPLGPLAQKLGFEPLAWALGALGQKNKKTKTWNVQTGGGPFSHFPDLCIYGFTRPPDPFHQTRSGLLYRKFTI